MQIDVWMNCNAKTDCLPLHSMQCKCLLLIQKIHIINDIKMKWINSKSKFRRKNKIKYS